MSHTSAGAGVAAAAAAAVAVDATTKAYVIFYVACVMP